MFEKLKKIYGFIKKLITNPKEAINSVRIPSLVDFIFKPWDDAIMNAPKENWDRLQLDKKSKIGLPVWSLFAILFGLIALYLFKGSLIFIINIVTYGGGTLVLIAVLYFIIKSFK